MLFTIIFTVLAAPTHKDTDKLTKHKHPKLEKRMYSGMGMGGMGMGGMGMGMGMGGMGMMGRGGWGY